MKMRHAAAIGFAAALLGAGTAQAQMAMVTPYDGPYVRLEGGWNHLNGFSGNGSTTSGAPAGALSFSTQLNEGYIAGVAGGWRWGPYRLELNFDYRNNDVDSLHVGSTGGILPSLAGKSGGSGNSWSVAPMVNGLYDLPWHWGQFTPYIGAGVGFTDVNLNAYAIGNQKIATSDDFDFSIQGMAGVRYDIDPVWSVALEYRFLNAFHPHQVDASGNTFTTNDYRNHSILLSVAYSFGGPPAPPPPAPPPQQAAATCPPNTTGTPPNCTPLPTGNDFLVFFDFNQSTITPDGMRVLDAAASTFLKKQQAVRIEVTGYTDTMGTASYNLGLSQRRAKAVSDYLSSKGVPAMDQNVAWKGKTDLRVQTPDQVREPQNRRVEIIMPQ